MKSIKIICITPQIYPMFRLIHVQLEGLATPTNDGEQKCLAWSGGLPLSSFVVRAESRNQSNESSKSRLPAELLEPAELQNDG